MPRRLVFTKSAERDFEAIACFIEADNPAAAARFVRQIRQRLEHLTDFPQTGRTRDDLRPDARTLAFDRRVTVIYRIGTDIVRVMRVHYRGRDVRGA